MEAARSSDGAVRAEFRGRQVELRLLAGAIDPLEDAHGLSTLWACGELGRAYAAAERYERDEWPCGQPFPGRDIKASFCRDVVAYALMGAGMAAAEANELVNGAETRDLPAMRILATTALAAAFAKRPGDDDGAAGAEGAPPPKEPTDSDSAG